MKFQKQMIFTETLLEFGVNEKKCTGFCRDYTSFGGDCIYQYLYIGAKNLFKVKAEHE